MGRKDRTFEGCGLGLGHHGPHPFTVSLVSYRVRTKLVTRRHDSEWLCHGVQSLSFATEAQGTHPERALFSDLRPCWEQHSAAPLLTGCRHSSFSEENAILSRRFTCGCLRQGQLEDNWLPSPG